MTYCLAVRHRDGLVFLSDTRTNAGLDNINTYRKMHVLRRDPGRVIVVQSAGNLGTTQQVLDHVMLGTGPASEVKGLDDVTHLHEAALIIGAVSQRVAAEHSRALGAIGADGTCTFIVGGQIGDEAPNLYLVYPEGNYIGLSDDRPFFQIGEAKYGKYPLELAAEREATGHPLELEHTVRVALVSMLATARSNLSVGPPFDLGVYRNNSFELNAARLDADSEYLQQLRTTLHARQLEVVDSLPPLPDSLL
jgi:putative proteasome-type protease